MKLSKILRKIHNFRTDWQRAQRQPIIKKRYNYYKRGRKR